MRLILLASLTAGLAGCGSLDAPEVKRCEEQLLAKLKAPASYKRVKLSVTDINPQNPSDLKNLTERWVTIEYDAVNSFNAPLRDTETCRYPLKNGQADLWNAVEDDLPVVENIIGSEFDSTAVSNSAAPEPAAQAMPDSDPEVDAANISSDAAQANEVYD